LLREQVGRVFDAVVLEADERGGTVVLDEPAVRASCTGSGLVAGERLGVRLVEADVTTRRVRFEPAALPA